MTMGLKIEIDSAAASAGTRLLKGQYFGMLNAFKGIEAFADKLPSGIRNDRTNACARRGKRCTTARKIQRLAHELFVL